MLNDCKITGYQNNIKDLPDRPNQAGMTAAKLKEFFDGRGDREIKERHNALIDTLAALGAESLMASADAARWKYLRVNSDGVLETSADGVTWEQTHNVTGDAGDLAEHKVSADAHKGLFDKANQRIDEAYYQIDEASPVGDIVETVSPTLGDKYLLCNGDELDAAAYPKLVEKLDYIKSDAINPTSVPLGSGSMTHPTYINGKYFCLSTDTGMSFADSPFGNWTYNVLFPGTVLEFRAMTYGNGYYVALFVNSYSVNIAYSTDLVTWSRADIGNVNSYIRGNKPIGISFTEGYFVIIGSSESDVQYIATFVDPTTAPSTTSWTVTATGISGVDAFYFLQIIKSQNTYVMLGTGGYWLYSTSLHGSYTKVSTGSDKFTSGLTQLIENKFVTIVGQEQYTNVRNIRVYVSDTYTSIGTIVKTLSVNIGTDRLEYAAVSGFNKVVVDKKIQYIVLIGPHLFYTDMWNGDYIENAKAVNVTQVAETKFIGTHSIIPGTNGFYLISPYSASCVYLFKDKYLLPRITGRSTNIQGTRVFIKAKE